MEPCRKPPFHYPAANCVDSGYLLLFAFPQFGVEIEEEALTSSPESVPSHGSLILNPKYTIVFPSPTARTMGRIGFPRFTGHSLWSFNSLGAQDWPISMDR